MRSFLASTLALMLRLQYINFYLKLRRPDYADETMTLAQFRVKNFWGKGDAYQGINSVYSIMVRTRRSPAAFPEPQPRCLRGSAARSDRPRPS